MGKLQDYQILLENHFSDLKGSRSTDYPIFSFEHGLTVESVNEIKSIVSEVKFFSSEFWLVWVLYATECGYEYDGGEYWETFQKDLKYDWGHDIRGSLRAWFNKFQKTYNGVKPQGRWAEHFSIIAWPITHAIVPRYLQLQLAKKLYELRYALKQARDLSPNQIGEILTQNSSDTTERFQIFLQQQEIVGRLAIAILFDKEDANKGDSHILGRTLQRIIGDLEQHTLAKSWLKEARRVVTQAPSRIELKSRTPSLPIGKTEALNFERQLSATPILVKTNDDSYSLGVQFDGFDRLAKKDTELSAFLLKYRSKISGACDNNPPGWLIRGLPKKILSKAPILGEPPITFVGASNSRIENLIRADCNFLTTDISIFKVNSDQSASHLRGRVIRVGWKNGYYLVTRRNISPKPFLSQVQLNCDGFYCLHINTEYPFEREDRDFLSQNGIELSKNVFITPIGFIPIEWDGEGYAEWMNTDLITLKIEDNFKVDRYEAILDGVKTIHESVDEKTTYININNLEPGMHRLKINAVEMKGWESISSAEIDIKIIDRASYVKPISKKSFIATILPDSKNLDDFWEQNLNIELFGPTGHQVELGLVLKSSNNLIIHNASIGKFTFPINQIDFRKQVSKFVSIDRNVLAYVEAGSADLLIDGKELGGYRFHFSRHVKPLRWGTLSSTQDIQIKLVNELDSIDSNGQTISFYPFTDYMNASEDYDPETSESYTTVIGSGGLYSVSSGNHFDNVVVGSRRITGGLQSLNPIRELMIPDYSSVRVEDVFRTIDVLGLWSGARCVGPLSSIRKSSVLKELKKYLVGQIATPGWVRRERDFLRSGNIFVIQSSNLAQRSSKAFEYFSNIRVGEIDLELMPDMFVSMIKRSGVSSDTNLIKCAFFLAVIPESLYIQNMEKSELTTHINELRSNLSLLQLARLLYLLWFMENKVD